MMAVPPARFRHGGALRWLLAVLLAFIMWSGFILYPAPTASAQSTDQSGGQSNGTGDRVQLIRLVADAAGPDAPEGSVKFDATVDYQMQTAPQGFLLWFFFDDDSRDATRNSADGRVVVVGDSGRTNLSTVYHPKDGTQNLTVLIGLFRPDESLMAWTATTPLSLAPLPGRAAFASAMAARIAGDYPKTLEALNTAIQQSPQNGTYYYWRADTQVHLGDYDEAIADYNQALQLQPQDRASQVGRGVALLWKQQWQPAVADLTQAIQGTQQPDQLTAWALRARGVALAALGQAPGAIADYKAYLTLVPGAPDRADVENWIADLSVR
jgi:tetratricopeptide (TPR) repeat protein